MHPGPTCCARSRPAASSPARPPLLSVFAWTVSLAATVVLEIAVSLRRHVHDEPVAASLVAALLFAAQPDVVQRDDARQRDHAADELAELVKSADQLHADRQLAVSLAAHLAHRLEQALLQARRKAGLGDVHQQAGHLGLARQLPEHGAEGALDFRELVPVSLQVRGQSLAVLEGGAQVQFLALHLFELGDLVSPHEVVGPADRHQHEDHADGDGAEQERPAADVLGVQRAELLEVVQGCSSWSSPMPTWRAARANCARRPEPSVAWSRPCPDCTTCSRGSPRVGEAAILRISAETRVLDSAMPRNSRLRPFCVNSVRCTPSGITATSWSNRNTTSGRARCRSSIAAMRASRRSLRSRRSRISLIWLSSLAISCCRRWLRMLTRNMISSPDRTAASEARAKFFWRSLRCCARQGSRLIRGISQSS